MSETHVPPVVDPNQGFNCVRCLAPVYVTWEPGWNALNVPESEKVCGACVYNEHFGKESK